MNIPKHYSQYLKKIEKLKNALKNNSWISIHFKKRLSEILKILEKKGITACHDLLNKELLENIDKSFDEYKELKHQFFSKIFSLLFFKGTISQKLREDYLPNYHLDKKERKPTKREELYDKIITYNYMYDYYKQNLIDRKKNMNIFPRKYNEIKNFYYSMLKKGIDVDNYKYVKFDKSFFNKYINILDIKNKDILADIIKEQKRQRVINNLNRVKNIPLKNRTFFYKNEKLVYGEDLQIEYKDYSFPFNESLRDEIKRQICGFLNSNGGRIFIGVNDNKKVNGIILDYPDRDKITNEIVNLTYCFYPKCRTNIDVNFIPIKNDENQFIKNLYIIKIIIAQGETDQLYSFTTKGFNSNLRLKGQCINLTAEEIRNQLIKREKKPQKKINYKEFKDPEPENPLIIENDEDFNENNYEENEEDEEYDESEEDSYDDEEEEEEEEEDEKELNYINLGTKEKYSEKDKYENKYTIKVKVIKKAEINPSKKEINSIFNCAKRCKKKFIKMGKDFYGYLNFDKMNDANLFIKTFNCNINPNYEFRLIPRF